MLISQAAIQILANVILLLLKKLIKQNVKLVMRRKFIYYFSLCNKYRLTKLHGCKY